MIAEVFFIRKYIPRSARLSQCRPPRPSQRRAPGAAAPPSSPQTVDSPRSLGTSPMRIVGLLYESLAVEYASKSFICRLLMTHDPRRSASQRRTTLRKTSWLKPAGTSATLLRLVVSQSISDTYECTGSPLMWVASGGMPVAG